ncbi:MAG: hypothetical protein AB8G18_09475 [Gammaproteobacteria bacterium]
MVNKFLLKRRLTFQNLFLFALATMLVACGGGDTGGNIGFADGQQPDPVVIDVPIAYVKRPVPVDGDMMLSVDDIREPVTFSAGADLYVRERASPTAVETNVTFPVTEGFGDVKNVSINAAGTRIVFALRLALLENVDDDEQPTWNIWEYNLETAELRRVISSDINAEAGHDVSPAFLPDDRIVFSSTRQRQSKAILLDEGKPQFSALDEDENVESFALHVMNDDGTDVRQITFNQSHDLDPTVRSDGKIVFSRWAAKSGNNSIGLYVARPDGIGEELLYGANSSNTGSDNTPVHFIESEEMPDGRIGVMVQPFEANRLGGQLTLIDTENYIENTQGNINNAGASGPAQEPATNNEVRTDNVLSAGGRYSDFFPLWDGSDRVFVSWSQCRVVVDDVITACTEELLAAPDTIEADPLYGLWVYDRSDDTQLPVVPPVEGVMVTEMVAAQPRPLPAILFDQAAGAELDTSLVEEGVGIINIKSVYDFSGVDLSGPGISALADPAQFTAEQRPIRFVRVVKAVSLPNDDLVDLNGSAFGRNRGLGMREIVAYAPVEPDGSVQLKVPADTALEINLLDANAQRVGFRHGSWLSVRPGEVKTCNGCHVGNTDEAHGRSDAFTAVNTGATTTSLPFPNTDAALFADFGETMAETRARISCATGCDSIIPSVDVVYEDVWTDEVAAGRPKDVSFSFAYTDMETPQPVSNACVAEWSATCRTIIHFEEHIHPLWSTPRVVLADDMVTVLSDRTCTTCHSPMDAMGVIQVPAGQLDLTDGQSPDNAAQFKSYRELLFNDNEQEVEMDALQDRLIQVGIDEETMEPIFATVNVRPALRAGSARASTAFFSVFANGGSHAGDLSPAELRLMSEWLDIGAQYYNDPFAVPQN